MSKRYFWLKLDRDFLKRHDTRLIYKKHGAEGIYIYIWLLTEAIDHNGALRFSNDVPYTAEIISDLVDIDEIIVAEILGSLEKYQIIKIDEDKTIEVLKLEKMLGSDTDDARRKREQRNGIETDNARTNSDKLGTNSDKLGQTWDKFGKCPTDKDKEKDKDKDKDKDKEFSFKSEKTTRDDGPLPDYEEFHKFFIRHFKYDPSDLPNLYSYLSDNKIKTWQASTIAWATGRKGASE